MSGASGKPPAEPPDPGDEDLDDLAAKLGPWVRMEARQALSEASIRPDPERIAAGWERRFIADARRAEEAVELYRELGYEVCADDVRPEDLPEGCDACALVTALRFKSIYTRRPERPTP